MSKEHADFDIEKATAMAKDYINATGMECLILKSDDKGILKPCATYGHDVLCYQKDGTIGKGCVETHLYGALHTKNTKKVFTYYCPVGLIHWAVPIVINDNIQGAFIGGHAFFNKTRKEMAVLRTLSEHHKAVIERYPELKKSLSSSPIINKEKLDSLKNILSLMAESLSDPTQDTPEIKARWEALLEKERELSTLEKEQSKKWQYYLNQMKQGKILEKEAALQELIANVKESQEDIDNIKSRLTLLLISLGEPKSEDGDDYYLSELALNAIQVLEPVTDREMLLKWIDKHVRQILQAGNYLPSIKHTDVVYKALAYIDEHYMEHIGLQDIADHVHFSPPYFSKIFKNEMNMTFTQYLTKVRIEESKRLLADKSIPLSSIPAQVGFEEQSYFSKVFRQSTGNTPGRYRESL